MNKIKRIISTLLTVCMLLGALSVIAVFEVSAETTAASNTVQLAENIDLTAIDYVNQKYYTAEEKLATMKLRFEKGDYQLWVNDYTGEVAVRNSKSGELLMSNPYDVGLSKESNAVKERLLSQIIVNYSSNDLTSGTGAFNSYKDAALNNQIKIKSIKNGIRVEYTLGREETKYLVPRLITKDRFETEILAPLEAGLREYNYNGDPEFYIYRIKAFFNIQDPEQASSKEEREKILNQYPITATLGAVYAIEDGIKPTELMELEGYIKTFCPAYTYEELDADHEQTGYVSKDQNPAVFKMALEYILDDMGLSVTLPANGIRFDESIYRLTSVTILPYMGSGAYSTARPNEGYTFIPDGSGAIIRFEDLSPTDQNISGKIYGEDYAYHTLSTKYQETFKIPVFGIVNDTTYKYVNNGNSYEVIKDDNAPTRGFFAIMEEGDALAELRAAHVGLKGDHHFHSVEISVNPRPQDTYNIADSISVSEGNTSWTVVSERKYLGNYKIRYIMLTDESLAKESGMETYYTPDYNGMAQAYKDYLTSPYSTGTQNNPVEEQTTVLQRLAADKIEKDIPLYLETFGTVETVEKILSIPVNVMTPLTTFKDIMTIYEDLSQEGVDIKNINFKLTGYANGGMFSTVPYGLKWEKAVGGKKGFKELLEFANDINKISSTDGKNLGIFPDFDFAYFNVSGAFDGFSLRKHAIKTIDDRYIGKATYSATYQTYVSDGSLAISPAYFSRFYDKLADNYLKYSLDGTGTDLNISVSTLGTDLNSDFDEDEPYNREDSKEFTIQAFKDFSETYGNVMTNGGNAYTWQYTDYILDMPIDSSRFLAATNTIPFTGMVLHGYKQYTGSPINMEGNTTYGILKAIENGASVYFILTYDNATVLKENAVLSRYYSVRYDIWAGSYNDDGEFEHGDLVDIYHQLNDVTHDLQDKLITKHEMLSGYRIPDENELKADADAQQKAEEEAAETARLEAEAKLREELLESRTTALTTAKNALANAEANKETIANAVANITTLVSEYKAIQKSISEAGADADLTALEGELVAKKAAIEAAYINTALKVYNDVKTSSETIHDKDRIINESIAYFIADGTYSEQFIADCQANVAPSKEYCDQIDAILEEVEGYYEEIFSVVDGIVVVEDEEEDVEEEEVNINNKYFVDDGTIVAVTYGEIGTDYRTFILNYNYYDVTVEYGGETYTVSEYGYVVIDHDKN